MKKKLKIILILFLLTGCSVNYKLEITNDSLIETGTTLFTLEELNGKGTKEKLNELIPKYFANDDILIGQTSQFIKTSNSKGYQIINKHPLVNLQNISAFTYCYDNVFTTNTETEISLTTSKGFMCYNYYEELENVTIHITSKLKNISNNADYIDGENYYWYITPDNYGNKEIYFKYKKGENIKFPLELVLIIGSLFVILIITAIILVGKKNNNNKI